MSSDGGELKQGERDCQSGAMRDGKNRPAFAFCVILADRVCRHPLICVGVLPA